MLLGYRNLFFFNLHRIACSSENSVPLCGLTVKTEEIVPSIFILFSVQISLIQPETGIRNDMYARTPRRRRPTCTVNIQNITHFLLSDMLRTALQRSFILGRKQADGSKQLVSCYPADKLLGFFSLLGVLQWGASKTLAFHFKTFHVFLLEDKEVFESFLFMKESLTYFSETNSAWYTFWLICHQNSAVWYQKIIEGKKKK